ncbi:MAG: hypothetical protein N3B13_06205 [Deltaproteobacteria bacterium]|nr:hypothetical protein [Deltaproteobacteria bacterium]
MSLKKKIIIPVFLVILVLLVVLFNPGARAKRLIDKGLQEAKNNNLHLAGKIFQRAAQICPECYLARYNLGNVFLATTYYNEALNEFYAAASIKPKDPLPLYEIARVHAILGHKETALFYLEQSVLNGFSDIRRLNNDPDLFSLHGNERFKKLITLWEKMNANRTDK